jgi:hypothetical protein
MPTALKREHPAIQNIKFLNFFLLLWVIFALLDLDPDPATQINADPCGSGSATLQKYTDSTLAVNVFSETKSFLTRIQNKAFCSARIWIQTQVMKN